MRMMRYAIAGALLMATGTITVAQQAAQTVRLRGTVEIGEEPILVQRLVPQVVQSFSTQWPDVRTTLNIAPRLSAVRGDPTYVQQVVRNLLTNAARTLEI